MLRARTVNGATYEFISDTAYRRIKEDGSAKEYECLAWGTETSSNPLTITPGHVEKYRSIYFIMKKDGDIVIHKSRYVVELADSEGDENE